MANHADLIKRIVKFFMRYDHTITVSVMQTAMLICQTGDENQTHDHDHRLHCDSKHPCTTNPPVFDQVNI